MEPKVSGELWLKTTALFFRKKNVCNTLIPFTIALWKKSIDDRDVGRSITNVGGHMD